MAEKVSRFPHTDPVSVGNLQIAADEILSLVSPYLTAERQARIASVVAGRTYSVVPVLENIYDRGNISAVMRTSEALGLQSVHVVEIGEKFKKANRVTQGADKWLDVERWKSTAECVQGLRDRGYRIYATHLDAAVPIADVDWSAPAAVVFGNEKEGVSQEMLAACDGRIIIPMAGFVQSFNISVAAAISLYHIVQDRVRRLGRHGDLSERERRILAAHYVLRSSKNPERLLRRLLERQ